GGTWGKEGVELSRFYAPSRYSVSGVPPNDPQIGPPGTLRPRLRIRAPGAFLCRRGRAMLLRTTFPPPHTIHAEMSPISSDCNWYAERRPSTESAAENSCGPVFPQRGALAP